ncbi:MAG: SDR family NAD(P)-dependent oxidoreductase, partial [Chloroflexota bacterium]
MPQLPASTPLQPRKRAIVVGASSGLGAALAKKLAREGWTLALLARRSNLLASLCADLNSGGATRALAYEHDVTELASVPETLKKIIADLGGLDLFIYNAGVNFPPGLESMNAETDIQMAQVNYLGAIAWLAPVGDLFKGAKSGTIVGISSVAGDRGRIGNPGYNASKAALTTYLEAMRNRFTRHGLHVLTVIPGFMQTDMLKAAQGATPFVIPPERAADDIYKAIVKRKQLIYTPSIWRWIML